MQFVLLDRSTARSAFSRLYANYSDAEYYLKFKTPIQLLVAAILSAQTRDDVVNAVTPELFRKYDTAEDYAKASTDDLIKYVGRVSFALAKSKNIISACRIIVEKYDGKVPKTLDELLELPGIGRKTANTILINAYGIVEGIPVDTWVIKLAHRIGLSDKEDPDGIEKDLEQLIDRRYWHNAAYALKAHGKKVCKSTLPECSKCVLNSMCPKNDVEKRL